MWEEGKERRKRRKMEELGIEREKREIGMVDREEEQRWIIREKKWIGR